MEARIEVRGGPFGLPGAEVLDSLAGVTIRLFGSSSQRRTRIIEVRVVGRFPRRGRHRLEPPALALSDPLGLVRVVRASRTGAQSLLVLPRTERLRWLAGDGGERLDRRRRRRSRRDAGRARGRRAAPLPAWVRPRRGSAGARWRAARACSSAGSGPSVTPAPSSFSTCAPTGPGEDIDAAVRAAASLTLELGRRGGCELLLPGDRRPLQIDSDLGAWPGAHARLALIEGGPDTPAPWPSARARTGAIFYVAAEASRLPARIMRGAHGGLVLVLPATVAPGRRALPRFEVTGCRGYVLAEGGARGVAEEQVA